MKIRHANNVLREVRPRGKQADECFLLERSSKYIRYLKRLNEAAVHDRMQCTCMRGEQDRRVPAANGTHRRAP